MALGSMALRLASLLLVGLVLGLGLTGIAYAQRRDPTTALEAEVDRLYKAGQFAEAIEIAKRVLSVRENTLGPEHPEVATWLNDLAVLYRLQGLHGEAEALYRRSLAIREKKLGPVHPNVGQSLNNLARLYQAQGRYDEAETFYRRSLDITEKALGPNHSNVATSLSNLASLYQAKGRYPEAEPLYRRSLGIREKAFGAEHPSVDASLNDLAGLYTAQGRYADAAPLYQRSLAFREKSLGPEHPDVGVSLNNLASLHQDQGRYAEAEQLYKRSLAIREKALGPDHPNVGTLLNNLASLYQAQGRYDEAEPLLKRSLGIAEKALGPDHPGTATVLNNLAGLQQTQGRYAEAEQLYKRSLAIREKALGLEHRDIGTSLNNLAALYWDQGRYGEAEPLLKRTLAIHERVVGPGHPDLGSMLNNLAANYQAQGRYAEAEPLLKRSLGITEKALGPQHPDTSGSLNNLASLYQAQGRHADAEPLYKRSLAIRVTVLGAEHPDVGASHSDLGSLYQDQGRYAEAEPVLQRSLSIREQALGANHPDVALSLNNLAELAYVQNGWSAAVDYWRRSTSITRRRAARGLVQDRGGPVLQGEPRRQAAPFERLVKAAHRMAARDAAASAPLAAEMFETAQWAHVSEAAASLAQMAARSAKGSPQLANLVRERQDLVGEWQMSDKQLIDAKSAPPADRKAEAEKTLADRLGAIDVRLAEIDRRLAREFPDYTALAHPAPVSVTEVQAQLAADEALVLFLDTAEWKPLPEETFVWFLTKSSLRWVRLGLGTPSLAREVAALRCGLDATAWDDDGAQKCAKALAMPLDTAPGQPLPFDHTRAHRLFASLFGELRDIMLGRHILIVPSGPLTQLPFQVLVTKPPTSGEHRSIAWLAREHALTVLPAVSSLKALRRVGKASAAPRLMLGIGNPLLDGPDGSYAERAQRAREKQACPATLRPPSAAPIQHRRRVLGGDTRAGLANVLQIRGLGPLPETADELCAVAQDLKAEAQDIRLGAQATEREVKRLSASGELAKYRIVHFATHGVLAGQLEGAREPGLILTPPNQASEEEDGYLSASEIAALRLDADWVILSACNTAASAATKSQPLSGLARAFMYAQARALLVSHWSVYSDATVKLVTAAVREIARDGNIGRAEALRRSMLALIDKGERHEAHPAYWAPFVVVGEGGGQR